jgi:hypothetical protein
MALRPGKRFEMSSHFMPFRRNSMASASSSGVHLPSFLGGESDGPRLVDCDAVRFAGMLEVLGNPVGAEPSGGREC